MLSDICLGQIGPGNPTASEYAYEVNNLPARGRLELSMLPDKVKLWWGAFIYTVYCNTAADVTA